MENIEIITKKIEENKLIAEFMGLVESGFNRTMVYDSINDIEYKPEELLYQSSWDWLMPVVEKINDIRIGNLVYDIESSKLRGNIIKQLIKFDILSTYKNVVEFIKWYNREGK